MFRTSNPALRNDAFRPAQTWDDLERQGRGGVFAPTADAGSVEARPAVDRSVMTLSGTVNKSFVLLGLCLTTAIFAWTVTTRPDPMVPPVLLTFGGGIAGFIVALIVGFRPQTSPALAPIYALLKGLFVGGLSAFYAMQFAKPGAGLATGLVFGAVIMTFGIFAGVLMGFRLGWIRATPGFAKFVVAATLGVCFYSLVAIVASLLGFGAMASVLNPANGGMISIGFSAFVVVIASANLVLDFEMISNGVQNKAPKYMEWYGGFALLVTVVWLYLEVLRLLAKIQSRD